MPRTRTANEAVQTSERLSVNVSRTTAETLRGLASAKSTTITEVIRQAVALLKIFEDERGAGSEVQFFNKGENEVRVVKVL